MHTLEIEINNETYTTLSDLAEENAIDLSTLLRMQAEQLAQTYRNSATTEEIGFHLAQSIEKHRHLLQRLAE